MAVSPESPNLPASGWSARSERFCSVECWGHCSGWSSAVVHRSPGSGGSWRTRTGARGLARRHHPSGDDRGEVGHQRQRCLPARCQPDPGPRTAARSVQASVIRPYTRRWAWWIGANLGSWLLIDALFFVLGSYFDGLDLTRHDGSVLQVYLMLIATTPLTGRALLWVLAPSALTEQPASAHLTQNG